MLTLSKRPYAGETDLDAIAQLLNICEAVDQLEGGTSVSELRQDFTEPSLDKARDLRLWEDADGELIGFGQLWISAASATETDGFLGFRVHPMARGGDLAEQIIAWGEGRMREVSQERNVPVKLRSGARAEEFPKIALLEAQGFTIDRYFFRMKRSLTLPIPEPQFPRGFTLRQLAGEQESEAWVEMFNQSFIDHWNHHPLTVEELNHELRDPHYRPELELIAIAPDGTFAAFCGCYINPEANRRRNCNEGWIGALGTRRGFRKRGLGRAMLLAGMQRLKLAGVDTAKLGVDAENPSGALRLYESVGFSKVHTSVSFVKDVL